MEFIKYGRNEIYAHIKHDLRQLPEGKNYGNENVDITLSYKNRSLIDRGSTAEKVNKYRKDFEKKIFKYKRKNLVHAIELVIQCPSDCPSEQHEAFFQTAFDWYCKLLPAGKNCVFLAEIHRDEHKWIKTENGIKDISKEHLHIAFVPAILAGKKHPDFKYRLNADALTKRAVLRELHPSLQAELDSKGIKATVYQKKSNGGKAIPLSVKQLKEITDKTGVVIDRALTIDKLVEILKTNHNITIYDKQLKTQLQNREEKIIALSATITKQDKTISEMKSKDSLKDSLIERLEKQIQQKEQAYQQLILETNLNIASKEATLENTTRNNEKLRQELKEMQAELNRSKEKIKNLEASAKKQIQLESNTTWGIQNSWGETSSWGNTNKTRTEEKTW